SKKSLILAALCVVAVLTIAAARISPSSHVVQDQPSATAKSTPAEGYNVHVLAPHLVDGHQMGPYHHYCKVMAPDPQIVCIIYHFYFNGTLPNGKMSIAQAVGHKPLSAAELKNYEAKK